MGQLLMTIVSFFFLLSSFLFFFGFFIAFFSVSRKSFFLTAHFRFECFFFFFCEFVPFGWVLLSICWLGRFFVCVRGSTLKYHLISNETKSRNKRMKEKKTTWNVRRGTFKIGAIESLMSSSKQRHTAHEQLIINFIINKLINRVNDKLCVLFATHTQARTRESTCTKLIERAHKSI